jgi:predicted nucleic acid-binding protein
MSDKVFIDTNIFVYAKLITGQEQVNSYWDSLIIASALENGCHPIQGVYEEGELSLEA